MKASECTSWVTANRTRIIEIVPDALSIHRVDDALTIMVSTVRKAKAAWHQQRDPKRASEQKRLLRVTFPDLTRITFQGPLCEPSPDGMMRTAAGWVRVAEPQTITPKRSELKIIPIRNAATGQQEGDEVEFRLGAQVAYGSYRNRNEYSVDHAPTQADYDAVVTALAALTGREA